MGSHERGRLFYGQRGYVVVGTPRDPTDEERKLYGIREGERIMEVQNFVPYSGRKNRSYCTREEEGLTRLTSVTR